MSKGRKGRLPDQILKDREEIARLYLQRWTQAEIGQKLGLSRQQVGYDLGALRQEWLQSSLLDFTARKAEELARIDRLEREYWDAWDASKRERETSTTEQTRDDDGQRVKAAIRKVGQTGDPRYLAGVERCIEQRAKILGLNAPTETRLTGKDGQAVAGTADVVKLLAAQLEQVHAADLPTAEKARLMATLTTPYLRAVDADVTGKRLEALEAVLLERGGKI
jgi:hypothetical protein